MPDLSRLFSTVVEPSDSKEWNGLSLDKPSKAVIASGVKDHALLWYVGAHIGIEVEEVGLCHPSDLGLEPPAPGIWIWEGRFVWTPGSYECPQDGSTDPVGSFRAPTDEEWVAIREGRCPWDEAEWRVPEESENPC